MTGVTATIVPIIAQQPAAPVEFLDLIDIRTADADGTQPDGAQPPFPTELLPHPFRGFVEDIADRKQVPADFAGIPTIIMAATAIGSAIHLRPMKHDDWSERPCLWGVVISPTGTMKSPTMDAATKPLKDHELARKKVWKTEYEAWKALPEDARKYTPAPIRDCYINDTATTEKIVHLMTPEGNGTPGHLLFYADELTA